MCVCVRARVYLCVCVCVCPRAIVCLCASVLLFCRLDFVNTYEWFWSVSLVSFGTFISARAGRKGKGVE